jgi:hypothetical protein
MLHGTGRGLHVDVPLSIMVAQRRPYGFIADELLPVTPVQKQSDIFYRFAHGQNNRYEAGLTLRAPGTEARKVHMYVGSDTYYTPNYALGTDWPVEDEVNADAILQWATNNANLVTDRLYMDYEVRLAELANTSTSVRTTMLVGCGWTTPAAPILTQLFDYKEKYRRATGMVPNRLIIPEGLRQYVALNTELRNVLFGDRGGTVEMPQLAALLGIEKVLIPQSQVNTAGEVETKNGSWTLADVWGDSHIWMAHVKTLAGKETDTWLNAFRWTSPALGQPWAVERYPFDPKKKSYDLSVGYYQAEKVISSDLAMRIKVNSY